MSSKHYRRTAGIALALFLILMFYYLMYSSLPNAEGSDSAKRSDSTYNGKFAKTNRKPFTKETLHERITVIIREFEDFDHALADMVDSLEKSLPRVKVLIVSDRVVYPPVKIHTKGFTQMFTLSKDLRSNHSLSCLCKNIDTDLVLILPDGITIKDWTVLKGAAIHLSKVNTQAVAIPVSGEKLSCSNITHDFKRWSVTFQDLNSTDRFGLCPYVKGHHGLLVNSEKFMTLNEPFSRPFPFTFYVQASAKKWRTTILKSGRLDKVKDLYKDPHASWKHKREEANRLRSFYKGIGVKHETLPSGLSQFYGCDKNTPRCFGSVLNDMPEFLSEDRWTPPCCLKALRETAVYVFNVLDQCGVSYWLEGGSLLGAARLKDIIPWDYDVDIGIYKADVSKCPPLMSATQDKFYDDSDFVWEKAIEGDFFRVQYSDINHLHVDIHPFYSKNGTMTKDTWFPTHRQDTEFPEKFLKPLTKIEFVGVQASAPNNVKTFLEFKFGRGVIENPRYPNYQKPIP